MRSWHAMRARRAGSALIRSHSHVGRESCRAAELRVVLPARHDLGRTGRRPATERGRPMEMAIGIALAIISLIEIIWISRTAIANAPK